MAKSSKKMALGKGLSAILNDPDLQQNSKTNAASSSPVIGNVFEIPLEQISENPYQPRTHFNFVNWLHLSVNWGLCNP
jgi:ParB family chromosome partitioning protein